MNHRASSHWSVGELRFATLPAVPRTLVREISEVFHLRQPAGIEPLPTHPLLLQSADDTWAVRLGPSVLALQTSTEEGYDLVAQRLAAIATIALPYLDTDFFTRTALRIVRSLPLSEAMAGTRAIAEPAYEFKMTLTNAKTGSSAEDRMHFAILETVGASRDVCIRDIGVYEEAVEAAHLDSVLKRLVDEVGGIELEPDRLTLERDAYPLELPQFDGLEGYTPVILNACSVAQGQGSAGVPDTVFWPTFASHGQTFIDEGGIIESRPDDRRTTAGDRGSTALEPHNGTERLNEDRIRLLARKYAGGSFSREDAARLEILQERILHVLPSVQRQDFEHLEGLAAVTRGVHERHRGRMRRLGLAK